MTSKLGSLLAGALLLVAVSAQGRVESRYYAQIHVLHATQEAAQSELATKYGGGGRVTAVQTPSGIVHVVELGPFADFGTASKETDRLFRLGVPALAVSADVTVPDSPSTTPQTLSASGHVEPPQAPNEPTDVVGASETSESALIDETPDAAQAVAPDAVSQQAQTPAEVTSTSSGRADATNQPTETTGYSGSREYGSMVAGGVLLALGLLGVMGVIAGARMRFIFYRSNSDAFATSGLIFIGVVVSTVVVLSAAKGGVGPGLLAACVPAAGLAALTVYSKTLDMRMDTLDAFCVACGKVLVFYTVIGRVTAFDRTRNSIHLVVLGLLVALAAKLVNNNAVIARRMLENFGIESLPERIDLIERWLSHRSARSTDIEALCAEYSAELRADPALRPLSNVESGLQTAH